MSEPPDAPGEAPAPTRRSSLFSTWITLACSALVIAVVGSHLVHSTPPLERLDRPEQSLERLVSRELDLREALLRGPAWERTLYAIFSGFDETLDEPSAWYEELTGSADLAAPPSPLADLYRVILLGEAGLGERARAVVGSWEAGRRRGRFAAWARAAYWGAPPDPQTGRRMLADVRGELPAGWFSDALVARIATRVGDSAAARAAAAAIERRGRSLLWRWRRLQAAELALAAAAIVVLVRLAVRRSPLPLAGAALPPFWPLHDGYAIFIRGAAGFLLVSWLPALFFPDRPLAAAAAGFGAGLPVLALTGSYLAAHSASAAASFGLRLPPGRARSLAVAVVTLAGLGIVGETLLGVGAGALGIHSHWADGFPEDLLWDPAWLVALNALDAVVWTPFVEELAFRGLFYGSLRRRLGVWPAALLSAAIFAVAHSYGTTGFASVLWSGLLWSLAYERTRSLLPGIIAHSANNLLVDVTYLSLLRL